MSYFPTESATARLHHANSPAGRPLGTSQPVTNTAFGYRPTEGAAVQTATGQPRHERAARAARIERAPPGAMAGNEQPPAQYRAIHTQAAGGAK